MNNPEDNPFSDLALHGLIILSRDTKPVTLQRLHGTMPMFRAAHFESAIARGWVRSQPPPRDSKDKGSRYTITDEGLAHIRHLVAVSQSMPVVPTT
ncbi:MAG: hypothetical protein J0L73_28395 [Verrucomicrobia bacterium]|nr:hypothetical protein [Verrucomicrobiota bacterium]